MPTNVEIKAKVADPEALKHRIASLADGPAETLFQEDTFFRVTTGRLKLRLISCGRGELIYYERDDSLGPRPSRYELAKIDEPASLLRVLTLGLGVRAVVRKRRLLYRRGPTRIHLDEVEGLGSFLELEVEMRPGEEKEAGDAIARDLMASLGVEERDLVTVAYIDLIEQGSD